MNLEFVACSDEPLMNDIHDVVLLDAMPPSEHSHLVYGSASNMQELSIGDERRSLSWLVLLAVGNNVLNELHQRCGSRIGFLQVHLPVQWHDKGLYEIWKGVIVK